MWACKEAPFEPKYVFPIKTVTVNPDTITVPPVVLDGIVVIPTTKSARAFPGNIVPYNLFADLPLLLPESTNYRLAGIAVGTTKDTSGVVYMRYVYNQQGVLESRRYWDFRWFYSPTGQPFVGIQYNVILDSQNRLVREYSDAYTTRYTAFPTLDDTYTYEGNQVVAVEQKRLVGMYPSPVLYRKITYNFKGNRVVGAVLSNYYDPVGFASMPTPVSITKRTISYLDGGKTIVEADTTPPFPNTTALRLARNEQTISEKGYLLSQSGTNSEYWTNIQFTYAYNGPDGLLSQRTELVNGLVYRFIYEKK